MIFTQIRSNDGTGTLSYLIADDQTLNGVLIDPNLEDLKSIEKLIAEKRINLKYIIDTHTHADHKTAAGVLKRNPGAKLIMHENTKNKWKVVDEGDKFGIGDILRANAEIEPDIYVNDDDEIVLDSLKMKFIFTPGHTDNHIAVLINDLLFTGDLLLIGQAGRSDLPGGNPEEQYDSLFNKILKLEDQTKIYPGHDYEDNEFSYLGDERRTNPFLSDMSKEEYLIFVKDFFPPFTDKENGKAILQCGTQRVSSKSGESFKNIPSDELNEMINNNENIFMLDVRESFELEFFGKIPGVFNIPMGELQQRLNEIPLNKSIIAICQSGNRSYEAAHYLSKKGFNRVYNLLGGTSGWMYSNAKKYQRTGA
jgi:sulfur dioxygenase